MQTFSYHAQARIYFKCIIACIGEEVTEANGLACSLLWQAPHIRRRKGICWLVAYVFNDASSANQAFCFSNCLSSFALL